MSYTSLRADVTLFRTAGARAGMRRSAFGFRPGVLGADIFS